MALTAAILVFALLAYYYVAMHGKAGVAHIGPVYVNAKELKLLLQDEDEQDALTVNLGLEIPGTAMYEDCKGDGAKTVCFWWRNISVNVEKPVAELRVKIHDYKEDEVKCADVEWTSMLHEIPLMDCFPFTQQVSEDKAHVVKDMHWYGGGEVYHMKWPMERIVIPMKPFISKDLIQDQEAYGSVLERYWLNSFGVAIVVDEDTPLHVSINEENSQQMCFKAEYINSPFQNPLNKYPTLKYSMCIGKDMRTTHTYIMKKHFQTPKEAPDERMFRYPIWSTWARYKIHVNRTYVMQYANEIKDYGFNNSLIEIDDMYATSHGEFDFDEKKFPNATKMVSDLHDMGFQVSVWVHPFANIDSPVFLEGMDRGFWLTDSTGKIPALIKWWNGVAGVLDTSNEEATEWYNERLKAMQKKYSIDSFKFDAGESQYVPMHYNSSVEFLDPNLYCSKYVKAIECLGKQLARQIEVRCGHKSQEYPVFVRMMDKDSNWNYSNGLLTVIPSALAMGLLGYPYILPDMIGGNCYDKAIHSQYLPDRELYIRWMQLTAYLPSMQFSVAPWQYGDDDVVRIALEMTRVHADVVTPLVMGLTQDAIGEGRLIK